MMASPAKRAEVVERTPAASPAGTARPSMVSVRDLSVRFRARGGAVHAVNGVSFDVVQGEVLGVLGESGSGKSVTLRALMGLHPKGRTTVEGQAIVDGQDVTRMRESELLAMRGRRVAMIFQEPMTALDPVFTIGEQIVETILRHDGISRRAAYARALELLEMVQIPSPRRRLAAYPHEMSGGMRQRAMIALALSCRPKLLLADEPTTALDVTVQIQIVLLLRELQRELGMSIIFVTHDVGVAAEIADRIAVMYAGRIVESGRTEDVIASPLHPYTSGLLNSTVHGQHRGAGPLEVIPGMPPDLRDLPPACSFAPRCPHARDICLAGIPPAVEPAGPGHLTRCVRVGNGGLNLPATRLDEGRRQR